MTQPRDEDWTGKLVEALERVHEVEGDYLEEMFRRREQRELSEARFPRSFPVYDPARDRLSFYMHAWHSEGIYAARRYPPLRTALENAISVVGQHPLLVPLVKEDGRGLEFSVRILNAQLNTSCLAVVAGLMSRARQVGQDGFRTASFELESLLDSGRDGVPPGSSGLTVGYHVSLFYGLGFAEDLQIADDITAVSLESTESFLNSDELERVAPGFAGGHGRTGVGALLSPVPWRLTLGPLDDESELELDWGRSFFEDASSFIKLLSLAHGVPVVPLIDIWYCIHRTSLHLLGQPHYHAGRKPTSWKLPLARLGKTSPLDGSAFDQTKDVFLGLDHRQLGDHLAPVVSRLSQALARTGQYAADDKILDVAIALEQMYRQGWSNSYQLKTRAAWLLESDAKARRGVFDDVGKLYGMRSTIIHANDTPSAEKKKEAFNRGFRVARRSVFRLLREGVPADWTDVVLGS